MRGEERVALCRRRDRSAGPKFSRSRFTSLTSHELILTCVRRLSTSFNSRLEDGSSHPVASPPSDCPRGCSPPSALALPLRADRRSLQIVGGGEFGAATAEALIQGPYNGHESLITILDRAAVPPAVDAASSDYNKVSPPLIPYLLRASHAQPRLPSTPARLPLAALAALADGGPDLQIIRSDYTDEFYADLACESIRKWRLPPYAPRYHESGCVIASNEKHEQRKYVFDSLAVNSRPGMGLPGRTAYQLHSSEEIRACYPEAVPTGPLADLVACELALAMSLAVLLM